MKPSALIFVLLLATSCSGGDEDDTTDDQQSLPPQCSSSGYIAFDPANHNAQELRLAAYDDMRQLMEEAEANPALAPANFDEARTLYQDTAIFREKVMTRVDEHFEVPPPVGMALDAAIIGGFEAGRTATTAFAVLAARETVEKTLVHFFFLSVYHEMVTGDRKTWDEAFGYWGASSTNDPSTRQGLSAITTERDEANNTDLGDTIFNGIVDGSCEMAKALLASGADSLDYQSVPQLRIIVEQVDLDMQKVLAYFAGHEALTMVALQEALATDPEASARLEVQLIAVEALFQPLERLMLAKGGESAARASRVRALLDAALADDSGAWKPDFDANAVIGELEAEYSLTVRG